MRPRVHLYTLCWDEADMLGFFFRHYDPWVDRYVVFDDGSTDGSREILAAHPKVELRSFARRDADSFCLSHQALQDEVWKASRGKADWVVITAIDEHLHVRGRAITDYLVEQKARGVTLLPALGFDMNHPTMPDDEGLLVDRVTRGRARIAFNKLSIFDPDAVKETGFASGRHRAAPVGKLILPARNEVMLWHYKHLGFERNAAREATQAERLGAKDVALNLGQHYRWSRQKLAAFWDQMERESNDLSAETFVPDRACVGPLWWNERTDIARAVSRSRESKSATESRSSAGPRNKGEPRIKADPKVSVLIKSYNHAPYIRRTIESVLAQSFQDFEIILTDDASTDATIAVIAGLDNPRIKLAVNPRNLGISGAMNATIARARGRYLAILNSDDWALPGRLRRQVEFLDANAHVGIVAALPRTVDERGEPKEAFNDFRASLALPDFSRRTWLRHFFAHGNCVCAPTAMIRREAYEDAGPYDRRLTNLQDFDMWVRMLLAGHTIHVLPEELTAFRIRDADANMSAPRPDTLIRHNFEISRIMRHFWTLDLNEFEVLFGDLAVDTRSAPLPVRIALLALNHSERAARLFALETLADAARGNDSLDRLRELTGTHDVFGAEVEHKLHHLWMEAKGLREENAALRAKLERQDRTLVRRAGKAIGRLRRRSAAAG